MALAFERAGSIDKKLWKSLAYAARYGHVGPNVTWHWPISELNSFNDALAELVEEEVEAMRDRGDRDR